MPELSSGIFYFITIKLNMTMALRSYLMLNQGKGSLSWNEVGSKFKVSGEAARSTWRRIKRDTPTVDDIVEPYLPKHLDKTFKDEGLYLILGCVHAPFTNKPFWKAMLSLAQERKNDISGIILNGDFLDLHSLSAYDKGKLAIKGVDLGMEYEGGRAYLDSLLRVLNDDIYKGWVRGNHEHRHYKYMKNVDNSKLGAALLSPEDALGLYSKNFDIHLDWVNDEIELGNATIIHGEYCNVHSAKKYIDVFKKNFIYNHCFSEDTEVLTQDGWKLFPDLKCIDKLGTVNLENQNFEWNDTDSFHEYDTFDELIHFKSHGIDLMVTPDHAMIQRNTKNELIRRPAKELENLSWWETIHGGFNVEEGVDLTDDFIRLLGWVVTDGCYHNNKYITIKQCNKEKVGVKHITDILDRLKQMYSVTYSKSKNYECGDIYLNKSELTDKIIKLCPNRKLNIWMHDFSKTQFDIFLKEVILGDGHINTSAKNSMQYYTGNKSDIDIMQSLCAKNNYRTNAIFREKGNGSWWTLTINTRHNTTVPTAVRIPYTGNVYCVSVKNQSLVLRRNGVTSVAGNTHRVQMHREGDHVAYNSGFMGDVNSPIFGYATKAMKKTWANAFTIATLYKGTTHVEQPVWIDNAFIHGGKIYK